MSKREIIFAALLAAACALLVVGVALFDVRVGFIVAGVLLAAWSAFVVGTATSAPVLPPSGDA